MYPKTLEKFVVSHLTTIRQAMIAINENWREVVLVEDSNHCIVGLINDGDIRRGLLSGLMMDSPVTTIMSRNFKSVSPDAGRVQVLDIMKALNIRQIPVLDSEKRLVSIHFLRDFIGNLQKPNPAVIMAGGLGTRLRPFTNNCPKPMMPVAGRPILERIVLHLVSHGIKEIHISVNYLAEIIEKHFGDGSGFGCHIKYLRETYPMGTGGSLSLLDGVTCPLIVMNGDQVTQADISKMLDFHERQGMDLTMGIRPYNVEVPFGVVKSHDGFLTEFIEKPVTTFMVNTGIYVLSPDVISFIKKDKEYPITNLLLELTHCGRKVGCHLIDEDWIDVGNPQDLCRANGVSHF